MERAISSSTCVRGDEIGAYLDGELSSDAELLFESHLAECLVCSAELRAQQGLMHTLDFAFSGDRTAELPDGFSHLIALRAESDVSGFRTWTVTGRALRLSAALALGVLLLLALGAGEKSFNRPWDIAVAALGLLELLSRFVYDLVFGLAVVVRGIGRWLIHSPSPWGALAIFLFSGAAIVLVRQVRRFHRS